MNLTIYYRHTPASRSFGKSRPAWFNHEICFANLLQSILKYGDKGTIRLEVLFDGTPEDLQNDFLSTYFSCENENHEQISKTAKVRMIKGGNQIAAWRACMAEASKDLESSDGNTMLYFLENDYLHAANWIEEFLSLRASGIPFDYISFYDHGDKYSPLYRKLRSKIVFSGTHHWRTVPSTCWTFLMSERTFRRDYLYFKYVERDRRNFPFLTKLLGRTLLTPMPGLSTHSAEGLLSPGVDWKAVAEQARADAQILSGQRKASSA